MSMETENLESSLPVPSVQKLASQRLGTVPARYIRDDLDRIIAGLFTDGNFRHVPLVDMNKLANQESQAIELQKLHDACKHWGIFQLIRVSDESLRNMSNEAQAFFDLPVKEKKRWAHKSGSLEGYGQAFVTSEEQKLDWSDIIFLKALPIQGRKLEFWPETLQISGGRSSN